jgi:large subunit ribosomal protein L7/L12
MKEKKSRKEETLKAIEAMTLNVSGISKSMARAVGAGEVQIVEISDKDSANYEVILKAVGNKVSAIKAIRSLTGMGLKESKKASESLPFTLLSGVTKEEALNAVSILEEAGGQAFLSGMPPTRKIRLRRAQKAIVEVDDATEQLQGAVAWLSDYLESVNRDTAEDVKKHQEYSSAIDDTLAQILRLRNEAVQ